MKKIIPYIFIALIITTFLAPVGIQTKGLIFPGTNFAEAESGGVALQAAGLAPINNGVNKPNQTLPQCRDWISVSLLGCIGQAIYYAIFIPTSYLFGLCGQFFDWTFFFSIQSSTYTSPFVVQGWGIVRDFVNMFFIFVLLYVAFSTILGTHGFKTKETIINVVIIGLLVNFSLFATQIIIDSSNILARVFYNSDSIKISMSTAGTCASLGGANNCGSLAPSTGGVVNTVTNVATLRNGTNINSAIKQGPNGEIPLSAAIVNKINPQNLLINSSHVGVVPDVLGNTPPDTGAVDANLFLLVTILTIAVNIIGIIVFLSTGLTFIARVIGLWMACIFVPFAFFSYTTPSMKTLDLVGWDHWLPDTLKQAFLAPVFIFFLYLILRFLETGLGLVQTSNSTDGVAFVLSVIVPFAFIMMLLWKAKDIASSMSGSMGQGITKGLAAIGGLALGGAGLVGAIAGRQTLGATAKYVQNDKAREKALKDGVPKGLSKLNPIAWAGAGRNYVQAKVAQGIHALPGGKDEHGTSIKLGERLQNADKNYIAHAKHDVDDKTKEIFGKDAKFSGLAEYEVEKVEKGLDLDAIAKKNFGGKKFKDLKGDEAQGVQDAYDRDERAITNGHGEVTRIGDKTSLAGDEKIASKDIVGAAKSNQALGEFVQTLRKSTYDIRNLPSLDPKSKGIGAKSIAALAGTAGLMAMSIKKGTGIDAGKGKGNYIDDIKEVVTSSLSNMSIKVSGGGGGGDHGGGGHDDHADGGHH